MSIKEIVQSLVTKNPELRNDMAYLVVSVWEAQGLGFYPHQRELLLSAELCTSEVIARTFRKTRTVEKPIAQRKQK